MKTKTTAGMEGWRWFGNAAHLCVGHHCRFHLATLVGGGFLVSTAGQHWPDRDAREIHASIFDPGWFADNKHLKGGFFDEAYMRRFGFGEIGGSGRKYETMVFKAGKPCSIKGCGCGLPMISGHMAMCGKLDRHPATIPAAPSSSSSS